MDSGRAVVKVEYEEIDWNVPLTEKPDFPTMPVYDYCGSDEPGHQVPLGDHLKKCKLFLPGRFPFAGYINSKREMIAQKICPIVEWWMYAIPGAAEHSVGVSTEIKWYYLEIPKEAYFNFLCNTKQKIGLSQNVIQIAWDNPKPTYEKLLCDLAHANT